MSIRREEVRRRLHELARPVAERIAEHRRREAFARAFAEVWPWFLAAPIARLVLAFAGFDLPGVGAFVALAPVAPAAVLLLTLLSGRGLGASRREALLLIDDELGLADRMSAAAEFLALPRRTAFMDAAIRDAERRIAEVGERWVAPPPVPLRVPRQAFWMLFLMFLLFGLPTWSPDWRRESALPDDGRELAASADDRPAARETRPRAKREEAEVEAREERRPGTTADESEGEVEDQADPEEDSEREKRSSSATGRSSRTQTSGGQSASRGQASQQSQPSKTGERPKQKTAKKNAKDGDPLEEKPTEKRDEKESGATVGRGSGKGSSKSPTASPWASKDQVSAKEEQEFDDDEEIQDDIDESKARGGVQPQLRSRKPPVNRDLQIGFGGGRPNPMANGRGGAGPPKKQRGVAQLVLGVHFPDQISGKPNPGLSKITQEQIEPQAEAADLARAADRGRRSSPSGHVARPLLLPWLQDVVRDYFSSSRKSIPRE